MLAISHHEPQNYHVLNLTAIRYAALIDMNKYPVEITKWPWDPLLCAEIITVKHLMHKTH